MSYEIRRAMELISEARRLIQEAAHKKQALESELRIANDLIIAAELSIPFVRSTLDSIPSDGSWMIVAGQCAKIIQEMLDNGTPLIEEEPLADTDPVEWRVRLTGLGQHHLQAR